VIGSDRFLQVKAAIGEGIDRLVLRQTRSVGVQRQVVVLVIVADAGELLDHRHACTLQDLSITHTRALQDQWRSVGTGRDDDHLLGTNSTRCLFRHHELRVRLRLGVGLVLNPDSALVVVKQDLDHLLVANDMEIGVLATPQLRVDVSVGGVLSSTVGADVLHPAFRAVVGVEVLQVLEFAVAQGVGGLDEGIFGALATVRAAGDVHRTLEAMHLFLAVAVVGFELSRSAHDRNIMSWRAMSNGNHGTGDMYSPVLKRTTGILSPAPSGIKGLDRLQDLRCHLKETLIPPRCTWAQMMRKKMSQTHLFQKWQQLISRPAFGIPGVKVVSLASCVNHPVD
jgi:hypothetical protein